MTSPAPSGVDGAGLAPSATLVRTSADARSDAAVAVPPARRTGAVIGYVMLALLALLPGALVRFGVTAEGTAVAPMLDALRAGLADIRFGTGTRFYLGVAGAALMLMLLLYPVRKLFAKRRHLGSVGSWFHVHMLFGLGGPVLVVYHSNFGLGGFNANVALWSMIVIVVSGLVGHFIYAKRSAEFYRGKERATDEIDAIAALLVQLDAMHPSRWNLIDALHATEVDLLTPRKGVLASIDARRQVGQQLSKLWVSTLWHVDQCAEQLALSAAEHQRVKTTIARHFKSYVRIARHTSTRSVREQIWARWRLFHLPLFLLMVVATVLHVIAVWGMDSAQPVRAEASATGASTPAVAVATVGAPSITSKRVRTSAVEPSSAPAEPPAAPAAAVGKPRAPVLPVAPVAPPRPPSASTSQPLPPAPGEPPKSAAQTVVRSATVLPNAGESGDGVAAVTRATTAAPSVPVEPLQPPPMGLGAPKPAIAEPGDAGSLTVQIAAFKARRETGQFSHSMIETGFELTGKHLKADCADCHKTPMRPVRQETPRACIDCHAKDDNHKGRRPTCVTCHTTNRWSQILRRN